MRTFHRLIIVGLCSWLLVGLVVGSVSARAQSSLPTLTNNPAHYINECKTFVGHKLYEPALFSCYNAYLLGSPDMGAVLYQLGVNKFFDEVTSSNLIQEYQAFKGSAEIQPLLRSIKFSSQSNYIAQGSIYGSWCLDEDSSEGTGHSGSELSGSDSSGYRRLVINPTGEYMQASANIEMGNFKYSKNTLFLGHPNFGQYQVKKLDHNQLILKYANQEKTQTYSRKSCTKQGLQRFIQVLINNKSSKNCDEIINYLGPQLIPIHYLPATIVNTLKQNPKQYHCPELIQMISKSQQSTLKQLSESQI